MKKISFQLSKRNVLIIGCFLIFALLITNRLRIWKNFDKTKGIYIEWTAANKENNIAYLLNFFKHDTVFVNKIISDIHSPYMIGYIDNNIKSYKQLDYTLQVKTGDTFILLINKYDKNDVREFTFFSFWLPYIIITIAFCGIWALIIYVFFEKADKFTYSFGRNKKNKM